MKMRKPLIIVAFILIAGFLSAQTLLPKIVFKEHPQTHNMHIASDGKFLYTCNGGKADYGQISKLDLNGTKIASYKIELDMRSIMYNPSDKKLYVNTYSQELYRINALSMGTYTKIFEFTDRSEQSAPALSANGKLIYFNDYGTLYVYSMKDGSLKKTIFGLKARDNAISGGTSVAVDKKHIYTWDADTKEVYVYDLKGKIITTLNLNQGSYGFSLSIANRLLWVSTDGNYEEGTWFGYELK